MSGILSSGVREEPPAVALLRAAPGQARVHRPSVPALDARRCEGCGRLSPPPLFYWCLLVHQTTLPGPKKKKRERDGVKLIHTHSVVRRLSQVSIF